MGSPGTLPITDSTRCALLRFLVTSVDCLTNVVASGRGAPLCLEPDEHPAIRAAAMLTAARTVNSRRRVCIVCIVEGARDRAGEPTGCVSRATVINLVQCSPELSR